jgi:hypothetical protein
MGPLIVILLQFKTRYHSTKNILINFNKLFYLIKPFTFVLEDLIKDYVKHVSSVFVVDCAHLPQNKQSWKAAVVVIFLLILLPFADS